MSSQEYDVVVIGCGSAGSRAAAVAHQSGARTLAIDNGPELGGLCILRGCMPTKTLLETAHRVHEIRDAGKFGIQVSPPQVDFTAHMDRMRQLVARFKKAKVSSIEGGGYELRRAPVTFMGPYRLRVGEDLIIAKSIVVATGSKVRPFPIPVPDDVELLTSDDMFLLESVPKRAVVVGAGAVGLEFATWLARMGCDVTLTVRSKLLHAQDPEMGEDLADALSKEMKLVLPAQLKSIRRNPDGSHALVVSKEGEDITLEADIVLDAIGRVPNYDDLELENAGIIEPFQIGDDLRSPQSHIFFAGDAAGRRLILHEANLEGRLAGLNACRVAEVLDGPLLKHDHSVPPISVIFTDPAYATTGLSLVECEAQGIPFEQATKRFPNQGRGIVMGQENGFVRLIVHRETRKVLGCQVLNSRADDLIHIPASVLTMDGTIDQMFRIPWYHPTLAEAFIEVCRDILSRLPSP